MTDPLPYGPGDNLPPEDADPLRERLLDRHGALIQLANNLLGDEPTRLPESITDEAGNEAASDYNRELMDCMKALEATRVAEKAPFLKSERTVDGVFVKVKKELEKLKSRVNAVKTIYERAKADRERREREAAEREAREKAEAARQEAAAAERAAMIAERETVDSALDTAIDAEKRAEQAEKDVVQIARDAEAKAADLSRSRSDRGSVSSLRTFWDYKDLDRETVDLEPLRAHIPWAAIETAVRSFVRAGGRDLGGVEIFENTESRTTR